MSRKINWFILLGVGIAALTSIFVYNRQAAGDKAKSPTAQQQAQNPGPTPAPSPTLEPAAEKAICTLTREQSPDLLGLKLGMKVEQVLALFPGSSEDRELRSELAKPPRLGATSFMIRPEKYGAKEKFTGIQQYTMQFFDGHLANVNAGYRGLEWKHVDEFVTKFSEGKNLPPLDAWEPYVGLDNQLKSLKCDGFEINVFAGGKGVDVNYVQIKDLVAEKELKERRAKARQEAPKTQ